MGEPDIEGVNVLAALAERIEDESARLIREAWGRADDVRVNYAFERATVAALRAPAFAERSLHLRRLAKAALPASLVPVARRAVKVADKLSRRVVAAAERARRSH